MLMAFVPPEEIGMLGSKPSNTPRLLSTPAMQERIASASELGENTPDGTVAAGESA